MLPTCSAMPWVIAGLIVYLATYRLTRSLSLRELSPASGPSLHLHLVGGLPGPDDRLADPAHRLRVGAHHADDAAVVEHVLGADRLGPDAALGERHVLGDAPRQVMADHQHVEVLVDRVDGERPGGVGAGRQDVGQAGDADDVRGVAAAGTLGVEAVDRPALDRRDRVGEEPGLVERVGVDGDLDVVLVGDRQAGVDDGGGGAPVLVELQAAGAGLDLLRERLGQAAVALAQDARR